MVIFVILKFHFAAKWVDRRRAREKCRESLRSYRKCQMRNDGGSKLWWIALGALWGSFNRPGEEQDVANTLRSIMSIAPRVLDWVASVYSANPCVRKHGECSSSVSVLLSKKCVWDIQVGTELKSNTIQCLDQILVCLQHVFSLKTYKRNLDIKRHYNK